MTEEAAQAQLRALYASETKAGRVLLSSTPALALGGRLFKKEVLRVGSWVHPATDARVTFSVEDLHAIAEATNRSMVVQGPIPFQDGHQGSAMSTLGRWSHFFVEGDRLMGVVEAGTDDIAAKLGTTIRDVSVYLDGTVKDSQGGEHHGVLSHHAGATSRTGWLGRPSPW